ncbi:hypothetical protein A2U01_0048308, partial [Trifolium medium]|nr:hypothetical protein [Trifolium medium]
MERLEDLFDVLRTLLLNTVGIMVSELGFSGAELSSFVVSSETIERVTNPPNRNLLGALPCACITGFMFG